MDLSTLRFVSDTTDLERASKVIQGLVTDVAKLDKASRDAAQTEAILAKAAKSNADANLQNAKAQDVRLKSTITADKADKANEQSVAKKTKAVESHTQATKENANILQRQTDIYNYQTQGFSKGQAGILANAKATGQWSKQLEEILELQRQFSTNTFDKSETGLKRMVKASKEASAAQGFLNEGYSLTSKQARELSNDLDRQSASLKQQGKSYQEISKAQEAYKQNFVNEAIALNKSSDALAVVEKQRRDAVSATNYLTQADEKMNAALNASNKAFDKAGTDSIVKYETALGQSGVSQDVATQRLAKYRVQLEQVQKQEQARREQHLTRALAPQATDVVVSLWSGQNPLTVLLQQGGQVNDLFMQSGIAAERFGEVVKKSMASMLPSLITVAKGVGGLIVDGFVSAGKAANDFLARSVRVSGALDAAWKKASENGPSQYAGRIAKLSTGLTLFASVSVAAAVVALGGLAVALVQVTKEHNELVKSLNLTGASLGLSADGVVKFAQSIQGVKTTEAISFIQELSKTGAKASTDLAGLTKVAVDLEKYGGVALKDTAKAYDDLQSKPFEGLMKIAEGTGQVSKETVDLAIKLKLAGDEVGLLKLANEQFIAANSKAVDGIKEQINPMSALWVTVKDGISFAWEGLKDFARTGIVLEGVVSVLRVIATGALALGVIFRSLGKSIAVAVSVYAETAASMNPFGDTSREQAVKNIQGVFAAYKDDMSDLKKTTDDAFNSIWGNVEKTRGLTDAARASNSAYATDSVKGLTDLEKSYNSIEKAELKKITRQQAINKAIEDYTQKNKQASQYQLDIITQGAGIAWDKANKNSGKQAAKELDQYADILNKVNGLSSSYNNELATLQKLRFQGKITEEQYVVAVEDLIKLQPFYIAQQKDINAAHDLSNRLLGKQDMLGKDYYKTLEQIDKYQKMGVENGGYSVEHAEKLRQAAFDQTELAKTRLKIEQDSAKLVEKYRDDIEKAQNASSLETANLDDRLALLGLTSEQQKVLRIEQERRNKLLAIDLKLQTQIQEVWDKWGNGEFGVDGATKAKAVIKELTEQAGVDAQNVNKETAVKFREDFDAELKQIKSGVTDSIVTALFEGGKAGSKKLRDVLVNVLRQKVTMVVDVGVNAFMNSMIGGFFGGGGGAGAGGAGGAMSMLSNGFSLYNAGSQALTLGSQYLSGTMSGSNVLGSVFANATGTGIDGLLATNGAFGTAPPAPGGVGGAGMAGAGAFAAVALAIGNAMGVFRSDRRNGGGIAGTLGSGDLYAWEERRDGGTLFDGPDFETQNLTAVYKERQRVRAENEAKVAAGGSIGYGESSYMDYLDKEYEQYVKDAEVLSKTLQTAFDAMRKSAGSMADTLGLSKEAVMSFTTSLGGEKGLNFDGLDANGQQKLVAQALATANNEIAQQLIGTWEKFTTTVLSTTPTGYGSGEEGQMVQTWDTIATTTEGMRYVASEYAKEGEKAIDTLTRLTVSFSTLKDISADLRVPFELAGLAGANAASKIADAFGGLETFVSDMSAYVGNYFTDAEKKENLARRASSALKAAGLDVSENDILGSSRTAVRKFVDGVLKEFGMESPQYVAAVKQANLLSSIYPAFEEAAETVTEGIGEISEAFKSLTEDIASLEIDYLRAQGKTTEADSAQRTLDTVGFDAATVALYDYKVALIASIEALDTAKVKLEEQTNIRLGFERQLLELSGDTAALRLLEIAGMDAANVALYDRVQALTAEKLVEREAEQAAQQQADIRLSLERQLLELQGDTAALRLLDIAGMDEYNISLYDQVQSLTAATAAAKEQADIRLSLERQLLELQEDTTALRLLEIQGMDSYNVSLYDQVQSLTAAADAAKTLADNSHNLRTSLISLEGRFTDGGFSRQYKAEDAAGQVSSLLASVGINKDTGAITSVLLNSTTDEIQGYFREIWEVLDTDEARLRLVEVSNAMLDLATVSETAAEKFQKQSDSFSKLATEVSSLFAARNSAGSLLDKIAGAMGNQGSFAAQREGELWNALGSTSDYKKKVELASQLTDIVLERQQLEIQNAERLLNFGQGLRDYVNGLKLSDLSPLTNAEKLAEASKQYSETLSKAIGGDTNAQSGLQSISSSYLELARTYYAGNEQFSDIFNSVTSALDTLGINSMTESQQQIAIGNQSLEELQKLYGITETAYEALNTQYENSLSQLIAAQDALVLQASSLEQLVSISNLLTDLPTEIAVRMPIVNTELSSLNSSSAGATSDSSNAELLEELKLLRIQVAKLEASNREDARMQADVYVGASQATADSIASATTKAARAAELKQGAIIK